MRQREWLRARLSLRAANRERVEHLLAELYREMGWPKFEYVVYMQSPPYYTDRTRYHGYQWRHPPTSFGDRIAALTTRQEPCADPWRDLHGDPRIFGRWHPGRLEEHLAPLAREVLDFAPMHLRPYVLEKPVEAHFNEDGRPHCADGPAVIWRDGKRQWWWNGVRATRHFIEDEPTLAYINSQRNAERKRVLIERYGEQRYLKDRRAQLRSEDEFGKLWVVRYKGRHGWYQSANGKRAFGPLREDEVFVEVINATPEPDGSYRTFFLRVPPSMKTPKQAVAWSFKLTNTKYEPVQQT